MSGAADELGATDGHNAAGVADTSVTSATDVMGMAWLGVAGAASATTKGAADVIAARMVETIWVMA